MTAGWGDVLAFMSVILILILSYELQQVKRELRRVSGGLDSIREKLGIVEPLKMPPELQGLIQAGRKIEAIKVYREATGAGLAEAKEAVERMVDRGAPGTSSIIQP